MMGIGNHLVGSTDPFIKKPKRINKSSKIVINMRKEVGQGTVL